MRAYLGVFKWWLSLLISALLLTGCGGGGGYSTSISGTAATGAALTGTVELVDANGVTKSVNIGAGGAFEVDTSDLSAPIMLRATGHGPRATGNGGNAGTVLYSMADGVTGVFNITPLTHLALELLRQGGSVGETADLAATFAAWHSAVNPAGLDALHIALLNAQATINANLQAQLTAHGLTPTTYDFLRTAFSADSSGVDAVLDAIHLTITGNQISLLGGDAPLPFDIHIGHTGYSIGGAGSLTVSVSISGVAGADITINGVPKPASQTEFCSGMTESNSSTR